ncbi:MAG: DEAD/DEAH box helicase [Phycisphaerae bacterium]|nr:DEAD/DEAH box helicase [Phycisphaerae bacterium]
MRSALTDTSGLNLHAQGHARCILHNLETPRDEWPAFRSDLDERLLYSANQMISNGLELFPGTTSRPLACNLLSRGAEALEFLCSTGTLGRSTHDEILKSAIAYHIAGFHARSYVLIQRLAAPDAELSEFPRLIVSLLRRELRDARERTYAFFDVRDFSDEGLAENLAAGESEDDNAIANLGRRSLVNSLSEYLEYVKSGDESLLERAILRCGQVADLARDARHVDLWWWGRATEHLLRELGDSSLWRGLADIGPRLPDGAPIRRYIQGHAPRDPAIVSLWPSQKHALDVIKDPAAPSFCIRMPTSAGKTKIAEFAIVRALLDNLTDPDAKCIYIAPYRSLAAEIESTLRDGLRALGIRVSEVYGGFDVSAAEEQLIQDTQILIATPEKLDAVVRLAPELLEAVRLVVFDEGHMAGDISERGLRAEFLINRLLYRLGRERCRHVFVSAVLPNPQDFASWIGGPTGEVVQSDWRPSRLVLGTFQWNRARVRLEYSHRGATRLEQATFVPRFVRVRQVQGLEGAGRRRNAFPHNAAEAYAATAVRFSASGTTMAFVPQARQVFATAREILFAIRLMAAVAESDGEVSTFQAPDPTTATMRECLATIAEELGENSEVAGFVQSGVAVHHGSLPTRVRIAIERLIRSGQLRLIVATTTLGQGVNLPVRTVLVRGLQQSQHSQVDSSTFWNIAGRAGRAMQENEGQVLFFIDETKPSWGVRRQQDMARALIEQAAVDAVIGLLHRALTYLGRVWTRSAPDVDFAGLCLKLAENDFTWAEEDERSTLQFIFDLIDQHLLAVAAEAGFGPSQPDRLQEVLRESLLFAQLGTHPIPLIDEDGATSLLAARLASVFRRIPDDNRRDRFYRMGFSLADCFAVEHASQHIVGLLQNAALWDEMPETDRIDLLMSLADIGLTMNAVRSMQSELPDSTREIVRGWLTGESCLSMANRGLSVGLNPDPGELSRFVERVCVYGLTWAVNGFVTFAKQQPEENDGGVPEVAGFFPAMFKMGVPDPLAAVFSPYVQLNRQIAQAAARACPFDVGRLSRAVAWLISSEVGEFESCGLQQTEAERLIALRRRWVEFTLEGVQDGTDTRRILVQPRRAARIRAGDTVLLRARPDRGLARFDVLHPEGRLIGRYHFNAAVPDWLNRPHAVLTVVRRVEPREGENTLVTIVSHRLSV